jgi:glycosidase/MoaA/NifB/PqqE/SkfB family radical SAM enzyme
MRHRIRLQAAAGAAFHGELGDWLKPFAESPAGIFETTLPVGIYAWKAKLDGAWLEPGGRTRSKGGVRNEVLVVGGTAEPILFAPALPCVVEEADGTLRVDVALRHGHGEWVRIWSREDPIDPFVPTEAHAVDVEDEHTVFRAVLPVSSAGVELEIEFAGGRVRGEHGPLRWTRPPRGERAPELGPVYVIFVDRFRRPNDPSWGVDPGAEVAAGGDLDGITASLDELAALGIETLYLTPIQVAASCHRYDLVDPLAIDPALGGEPALRRLLDAAHARGLRVLIDFSFVHVGRGFPAYDDVERHGRSSRFAHWFQWNGDALRHYGRRTDAPLLDLDAPEVRALALETVERLARLGIDGFRFDAVADVPFDLARAVRERLRSIKSDAIVLGEVVPPHGWRWRAEGAVDLVTDFAFHSLATDFVARRAIDAAAFATGLRRAEIARGGADAQAVRFLSTHDHPRFASIARQIGDLRRSALGLLLLLSSPGIPALLYGEEIGLSQPEPILDPEDAWNDRMPMRWDPAGRDESLRATVARLLSLRKAQAALRRGTSEILHAEGPLLIFRRRAGGEIVDVVVHAGDEPLEIELEDDERPILEVLARVGEVRVDGAAIVLGSNAGAILRRSAGDRLRGLRQAEIVALPVVRDQAFRAGEVGFAGRPTRFDLSITERCNLRCAHCLTLAPARTASGTARTMSPAVLDRIRDGLAYASWVGFVHGGESLTAPILWDVLGAVPRAAMVHLLTNGRSLGRATTERLVEAGVRSLFVSLDGATGATNDRIRIGGDFATICGNVRSAVAVRRAGADLRVGLSFVVMHANLGELARFVDLAADLGVDWIKLEEPIGATPFARAELVDVEAGDVRAAIEAAIARARGHGIVAVDHTRTRPALWCEDDAETRAFLEADAFANRTEIHACREAWERVCVFPNGDVALEDFLTPVIGNVLQSPLETIFRSEDARRIRSAARERWICGGRLTCL